MQGGKQKKNQTVFVGLSGGVDSSVAALRLKVQGYNVVGVFIKVWQPDFLNCNWERERLDAMRVAATLGIPFRTFDAVTVYRNLVAEYMIDEYKAGRTPNPDVMCNQYVKFGAFLEYALKEGADYVATGHYAQRIEKGGIVRLYRSVDTAKDQSYFLWRLTQKELSHALFPVGDTHKSALRKEAAKHSLPTAQKQDSQGVCFLGQLDMQDFLSHYITPEEGVVLDIEGRSIGTHAGSLFYTIGQRHGFTINTKETATKPYYVYKKDLNKNTISVSHDKPTITGAVLRLSDTHFTHKKPTPGDVLFAQIRYREEPRTIVVDSISDNVLTVHADEPLSAPALGQSCVLYSGKECLGGGIIESISV